MPLEWVPLGLYDLGLNVNPGTQADFSMLGLDATGDAAVIGRLEDEQRRPKLLRVLGVWTVYWSDVASTLGEVYVRTWPGFFDDFSGGVIVPGPLHVPGTDNAGGPANEKWWWERVRGTTSIPASSNRWDVPGDTYSHPWHFFADFKPNYRMGENEFPCISVQNTTSQRVTFVHRWRGLFMV